MRWKLVTTFATAAVVALPSQALAAFPGAPGRLAFDDGANIFTVQPDGTGLRQLTTDGHSLNPRWSADGTEIAFNRDHNLYVMSATGTGVRRVTTLGRAYQPAWSPDGSSIAFVHVPKGLPGDIWVVPSAGGTAVRLTHDAATTCGDAHPVWSPAGNRLAYDQAPGTPLGFGSCANVGWSQVVLRRTSGATSTIPAASDPDFTADGRGLVFASALWPGGFVGAPWELGASDLSGGNRVQLTAVFCAEGDPCFLEAAASPASSVGSPDAVWVESRDDGSLCVTPTAGRGWCRTPGTFPFVQHLDWQAR